METFPINMKPSECAANNGDIKITKAGGKERKQKVSLEILTGLPKLPYSIRNRRERNAHLISNVSGRSGSLGTIKRIDCLQTASYGNISKS